MQSEGELAFALAEVATHLVLFGARLAKARRGDEREGDGDREQRSAERREKEQDAGDGLREQERALAERRRDLLLVERVRTTEREYEHGDEVAGEDLGNLLALNQRHDEAHDR